MDDEVFSIEEAAQFLKLGHRTIYAMVRKGTLAAGRLSKRGKYRILKSSCIACIQSLQQNSRVDGIDRIVEKHTTWQSNSGVTPGTVTSMRRTEAALDAQLGLRTKGKHRNITTG